MFIEFKTFLKRTIKLIIKLMKKILLMIVGLLGIIPLLYSQEISKITGNAKVQISTEESYTINFTAPLKETTKITVLASHGRINKKDNPNKFEIIAVTGSSNIHFSVFWDSIPTNAAFIIAYKTTESGKVSVLENINITREKPESNAVSTSRSLLYSTLENSGTVSGDIITFSVEHYNPSRTVINKWIYDTKLFEEVERQPGYIKLRAKQIIGMKNVSVSVEIDYIILDLWIYTKRERSTHTWGFYLFGRPEIKSMNNVSCSGENITYNIENSPMIMDTSTEMTWEAVSNASLVFSGSGNSSGVFKSLGNGTVKVKAKVVIKGTGQNNKNFRREYVIENSDVWIGAPLKPLITPVFSKFFAGSSYDVMITNVSPGSKVTWDISGATITSQTENSVLIKVANFDLDASVFIIATVENKCGTSRSSMSIPVKGLGGGGGVYPEI